jgi:hypothetical protein
VDAVSNGKIDYSLMEAWISDATDALDQWERTPDEATATELLLLSIARSLQAIAVALAANHLGDEYP